MLKKCFIKALMFFGACMVFALLFSFVSSFLAKLWVYSGFILSIVVFIYSLITGDTDL